MFQFPRTQDCSICLNSLELKLTNLFFHSYLYNYLITISFFSFQLQKFLILKGPDSEDEKVGSQMHMEKFWYWLQDKGITSHRSAIVKSIAEKMNNMMPGIYDASAYADEDDESDEE